MARDSAHRPPSGRKEIRRDSAGDIREPRGTFRGTRNPEGLPEGLPESPGDFFRDLSRAPSLRFSPVIRQVEASWPRRRYQRASLSVNIKHPMFTKLQTDRKRKPGMRRTGWAASSLRPSMRCRGSVIFVSMPPRGYITPGGTSIMFPKGQTSV